MSSLARRHPIIAGVATAFVLVALVAVLVRRQHHPSAVRRGASAPLTALSTVPYVESEVRDQDIAFFTRRTVEDTASATDRFALAGLLFTRSRQTGSVADLARAEALARESIAERTNRNSQAFELLASVLMARHEFAEARETAVRADALDPENPSLIALLGEIELELGQYAAAAAHFNAVHIDRGQFTTGARLARWYEVTGHIDIARWFLKQAIAKVDRRDDLPREQVAWFHYRLGELELRAGNAAAAETAFTSGLNRHPEDFRVLGGLARAALARGHWQQAVDFGERGIAIQLDPATLGTVSRAYAALGDTAQSASYARAMSVSALRQPGVIHRAWGQFLLDYGTASERATVLARARRELRSRKDVYGHDLVAWALYRNGRLEEAKREMMLALAQQTEDVMLARHGREIGAP